VPAPAYEGRVRFPDTDYARLPFFGLYFYWFHHAYEDALAREGIRFADLIGKHGVSAPAVETRCRYLRPLPLGESYRIDLRVAEFSARGWTVEYRLTRADDGELAAEAEVRNRFVDIAEKRGTELEGELLELARRFAEAHAQWPA